MKVYLGPYEKKRIIDVRIDSYDVVDVSHTLSLIALPLLQTYKKNMRGSPMILRDPDPSEWTKKDSDKNEKMWLKILNKMIFAFKALNTDGEYENRFFTWKDGIIESCDHEGLKKYEERIQEGFELFGEHFRALWT